MDDSQIWVIMVPSLSNPEPLKVTSDPQSAGEGVMEAIVATGSALGLMTNVVIFHSDHRELLSCTRKKIVWLPALRSVVLKFASELSSPSMDDSQM